MSSTTFIPPSIIRWPWLDRAGKLSGLKLAFFLAVLAPGLYVLAQALTGTLGVRPVTEAIHQTGDWTIRLLILTLAVTPLRRVAQWPRLVSVRRMLGVACLAYAAIHLSLFTLDQKFDFLHVGAEILLRFYLLLGFVAFLGLCALGWTSTDAAIKRMGAPAWNRLHILVYPIAVLGLVHFALQSKRDVSEAMTLAGIFILLMLARRVDGRGTARPLVLIGLAIVAALASAFGEAAWYGVTTGIAPLPVLMVNLDPDMFPRPCWWVLGAGLVLAGLRQIRPRPVPKSRA